ncbi:hypothetical protein HDU83_004895 [Entophlyctis luteolus]|nr:hypothetical protein HDU83_004895 [Entophlyctis luteolus]
MKDTVLPTIASIVAASDERINIASKAEGTPNLADASTSDDEDDHFQDAVDYAGMPRILSYRGTYLFIPDQHQLSDAEPSSPASSTRQSDSSPGFGKSRKGSLLKHGPSWRKSSADQKKRILQLRSDITDDALLEEIAEVETALELFLNSQFKDAEELLLPKYGQSMYFTEGVALLRTLRALMTFDPDDMSTALDSLNCASEIASSLRKRDNNGLFGMISGAAGIVTGNKDPNYLNGMSRVQKHAELVYAETSCIQSLLTLVANTNLVNFVKEGMQMRSSFTVVKACFRFLEKIYDEEGVDGYVSHSIDEHFISGIVSCAGLFGLILSFLPSKIIKVFELIGFQGDRDTALDRLSMSAGWPFTPSIFVTGNPKAFARFKRCFPSIPQSMQTSRSGGLRKPLSELMMFSYHIVLASMNPLPDCNLPLASLRLEQCLERRDQSFLYRALRARMLETEGKADLAEIEYNKVISLQKDYRQLYHACLWDVGLCQMAQRKWISAFGGYSVLFEESKWSRAIYRYMQAVTLYAENASDSRVPEMMKEVPGLLKKIAGISVPMEKFVSRKSRKFAKQGGSLLFPAYEILYFFHGLVMMGKDALEVIVKEADKVITELDEKKKRTENLPYETFFDDLCLALFLKAVAEREIGYPTVRTLDEISNQVLQGQKFKSALQGSASSADLSQDKVNSLKNSISGFKRLIAEAKSIVLDHWMLLYGRYELGSLYLRVGEYELARREFEAARNKGAVDGEEGNGVKKASLENMLQVRCHNALLKLKALEENSKLSLSDEL